MTRRLVLSYLAITVIVLAVLEIPLAVFYAQREEERFTNAVERDATVLASFYEDVLQEGLAADPTLAEEYSERTGARVVVVDTDGISLLDTEAPANRDFSTRPEINTALGGVRSSGIRHSDTLGIDLLFVAAPVASGGIVHGAVRVTTNAEQVGQRIRRFWISLLGVAAVVLVAVAGLGWAIARSVTKPLRQLRAAADRFSGGDLRPQPIDTDAPEEITALGDAMNQMATRLDELIASQREFVGDASHQLRTPLTALRLRLENLESSLDDPGEVAETGAAISEIERLSALVDDLLHLARAQQPREVRSVDASAIVADRVDTWGAVASDAGITLELDAPAGDVAVMAIPGALEQVLDNAIDNALQYSPQGEAVTVRVLIDGPAATVAVSDTGPGLADAAKQKAQERFWRGSTDTPGSGLGLAIAKSLTEASNGSFDLGDTPGGGLTVQATFTVAGVGHSMAKRPSVRR